jgi:hypothetical protein
MEPLYGENKAYLLFGRSALIGRAARTEIGPTETRNGDTVGLCRH